MGQSLDSMLCQAADAGDLPGVESAIEQLEAQVETDVVFSAVPRVDKGRTVGKTALMLASARGHTDIVRALIQHGAHVDAARKMYCPDDNPQFSQRENIGWTALMEAAEAGHVDVLAILLHAGASINAAAEDGSTALYRAVVTGRPDVVQLLLDAGASVEYGKRPLARMAYGMTDTPLMNALRRGHTEIVVELINAGADVCWYDGHTVLMQIARCHSDSSDDVLSLLMRAGAGRVLDVDYPGRWHAGTALSMAAEANNVAVVRFLVDAGADVNLQPWGNLPPLEIARTNGYMDVCRILLEAGAFISDDLCTEQDLGQQHSDDVDLPRQCIAAALYGVTWDGSERWTLTKEARVSWDAACSVLMLQHMHNYAWRRRMHAVRAREGLERS